jgi:hypothetical protein
VLGVDKLINIPVLEVVPFGITQDADVPWIVRPAFTPEKALELTVTVVDVDVYPRIIVARLEQPLKELVPIVVTVDGIVSEVIPVLPLKALSPIVIILVVDGVVVDTIVTVVLVVDKVLNILFGITQFVVVPCIVIPALIPEKALELTVTVVDVDVYPRLIVARLEQPLKELVPIVVTVDGIVSEVIPVLPLKA